MPRLLRVALLAVPALAAAAVPGRAQVVIHAPFVTVAVGRPGVAVHVPGVVDVQVGRPGPGPAEAAPADLPPPRPVTDPPPDPDELPAPRPVPASVAPPAVVRPLTLAEFASAFRPVPGTHQVLLVHPRTGRPVPVEFTLPPGVPRRVSVRRHELAFDYGRDEVTIRFGLLGRVWVSYR